VEAKGNKKPDYLSRGGTSGSGGGLGRTKKKKKKNLCQGREIGLEGKKTLNQDHREKRSTKKNQGWAQGITEKKVPQGGISGKEKLA